MVIRNIHFCFAKGLNGEKMCWNGFERGGFRGRVSRFRKTRPKLAGELRPPPRATRAKQAAPEPGGNETKETPEHDIP